jgi:hypothetical protein
VGDLDVFQFTGPDIGCGTQLSCTDRLLDVLHFMKHEAYFRVPQ